MSEQDPGYALWESLRELLDDQVLQAGYHRFAEAMNSAAASVVEAFNGRCDVSEVKKPGEATWAAWCKHPLSKDTRRWIDLPFFDRQHWAFTEAAAYEAVKIRLKKQNKEPKHS